MGNPSKMQKIINRLPENDPVLALMKEDYSSRMQNKVDIGSFRGQFSVDKTKTFEEEKSINLPSNKNPFDITMPSMSRLEKYQFAFKIYIKIKEEIELEGLSDDQVKAEKLILDQQYKQFTESE
jgi:hypothetical protein